MSIIGSKKSNIAIICLLIILGCTDDLVLVKDKTDIELKVKKWLNGKQAAVTLNYDANYTGQPILLEAIDEVVKRNLTMDFELLSSHYELSNLIYISQLRDVYSRQGIGCFGHGHVHVSHDKMSYQDAFNSFKKCYDLMNEWGLNPRTYAYPGACGFSEQTQKANRDAGFIAARGAYGRSKSEKFYICPNDYPEPENWYFLPSIVMGQSTSPEENAKAHFELLPYLEKNLALGSWVILLYHSIGVENGWAYYPMEEFIKDVDYLTNENLWVGNMDDVACYIYELNNFDYELLKLENKDWDYGVLIKDNLDNKKFDQELTIEIDFRSPQQFKFLEIEVSSDSIAIVDIINNKCSINILPDENIHRFRLK